MVLGWHSEGPQVIPESAQEGPQMAPQSASEDLQKDPVQVNMLLLQADRTMSKRRFQSVTAVIWRHISNL